MITGYKDLATAVRHRVRLLCVEKAVVLRDSIKIYALSILQWRMGAGNSITTPSLV
jgi:hypothetical protein